MDIETSLITFDIFVVAAFAWFYYYFHTMITAVLEFNDELVKKIKEGQTVVTPSEDNMQMRLDDWLGDEEE